MISLLSYSRIEFENAVSLKINCSYVLKKWKTKSLLNLGYQGSH